MNKYMQWAKDLAEENLITKNGGPFGAVIVKNGAVIGRGSNQVLKNNDPTAHAEIMAIRDACRNINCYDLSGCTLYTSCYPCPMCLSATIWANIKQVYYGNTKKDAANIGFRDDYIYKFIKHINKPDLENAPLNLTQVDRDETIETFNKYIEDDTNKIY